MKQHHFPLRDMLLFAALTMGFWGCATIFNGSTDKVVLKSEPEGASVYVDGKLRGMTPDEIELEVKSSHSLEFRKEGYTSKTVTLEHSVSAGWIALDFMYTSLNIAAAASGPIFESSSQRQRREDTLPIAVIMSFAPFAVDAISGKWYSFNQDQVKVLLEQEQVAHE